MNEREYSRIAARDNECALSVREIPSAEPTVCQRNGIRYFNFQMADHTAPDDKAVNEILSIIQNIKEPVLRLMCIRVAYPPSLKLAFPAFISSSKTAFLQFNVACPQTEELVAA